MSIELFLLLGLIICTVLYDVPRTMEPQYADIPLEIKLHVESPHVLGFCFAAHVGMLFSMLRTLGIYWHAVSHVLSVEITVGLKS